MRKYRNLSSFEKAEVKAKIIAMYLEGYSQGQIAKILTKELQIKINKSQVNRIVKEYTENQKSQRITKQIRLENIYNSLPETLKESIRNEMLKVHERKNRSFGAQKTKTYRRFKDQLKEYGILDEKTGREFISLFIEKEFGHWANLELKRRPDKEKPKFYLPKGRLHRPPGLIEIDATQISTAENQIEKEGKILESLILIIEPYSGYIYPEPAIITSKTKKINYYNRAFNIYDSAKYQMIFISTYGKPKQIRLDNDKTLKNRYYDTVYKERLKIPVSYVYNPQQKFIERVIKDIKDELISLILDAKTIEEAQQKVKEAIKIYNTSYHKFNHFNQKHIPEEVFACSIQEFTPISEEEVRAAFMEEKLFTVRNNKITWDGYVYEFLITPNIREGDYGRKPKQPQVIVRRHIDNASFLEVYDADTGEYLGEARLISSDVPTLDLAQRRQLKNAEKRAKQKAKKLTEEIQTINEEVEKVKQEIYESNLVKPDEILNAPFTEEEEPQEELPNVWEILSGGVNDD